MPLEARQRTMITVAAGAVAVLAFNGLALQPYLAYRADLIGRRDAAAAQMREYRTLLDDEQHLEQQTSRMKIAPDPAAAEAQLVHLVHDWEEHAHLSGGSFQQQRAGTVPGLIRLTFAVSATGTLPGMALLLHDAESASLPLRVDSVHLVAARDGTGEELQMDLAVSTLCKAAGGSPGGSPRWIGATALAGDADAVR